MGPLPTGKIGRKIASIRKNTLDSNLHWKILENEAKKNALQNYPLKTKDFLPDWNLDGSFYPHWVSSTVDVSLFQTAETSKFFERRIGIIRRPFRRPFKFLLGTIFPGDGLFGKNGYEDLPLGRLWQDSKAPDFNHIDRVDILLFLH